LSLSAEGHPVYYRTGSTDTDVINDILVREEYACEYGTNKLEIHADAVGHGHRGLVVDDLLATGGTIAGTLRLLKKLGANVVGTAVLIELEALNGRAALNGAPLTSFIKY